jgi:hypothetical protein
MAKNNDNTILLVLGAIAVGFFALMRMGSGSTKEPRGSLPGPSNAPTGGPSMMPSITLPSIKLPSMQAPDVNVTVEGGQSKGGSDAPTETVTQPKYRSTLQRHGLDTKSGFESPHTEFTRTSSPSVSNEDVTFDPYIGKVTSENI